MGKHHGPRRPAIGRAPMDGYACDIAVSEMTGVPAEEICGWVLVVVRHTGNPGGEGSHQPVLVPCDREYVQSGGARVALERALADLEATGLEGR